MVGSQQGVPGVDRFGAAGCPGVNSPRGILSSHSHMSPESVRLIHRHRSVTHTHGHTDTFIKTWRLQCYNIVSVLQSSEPPGIDPSLVLLSVLSYIE